MKNNFEQQSDSCRYTVLIVDNDRDNLLLASCIIESMGLNYVVTNDSEKCLDLIYSLLPNLILLDVVMPGIDGIEITKIVKQNHDLSHIPIIAVTGLAKVEDENRLIAAGFDGYICKPYLIEDFELMVNKFLDLLIV